MEIEKIEVFRPVCNPSATFVNAALYLEEDATPLLPYLNATQKKTQYYPNVPYLKFTWDGHRVVVEGKAMRIYGFEDDLSAREGAMRLMEIIRNVEQKKADLKPNHTPYQAPTALEILKHLPKKSGCSQCGYPTCMAFAVALLNDETEIKVCKPLSNESALADKLKKLGEII